MTSTLRNSHLVVGAITVIAALVTGQIMSLHQPPMAGRPPGPISNLGLVALFGGVLLYALVTLKKPTERPA